jgi:folate-binding Fe-S cluster repair protein YgfZ
MNAEGIDNKIREKAYSIFCEKIKNFDFIDMNQLENCTNDIINLIKEDENEVVVKEIDIFYDKSLTRSSSSSSLVHLFNSFDQNHKNSPKFQSNDFLIEEKDKNKYIGKKRTKEKSL